MTASVMTMKFNARDLYDVYLVEALIRGKICGGKPKSASLLEDHIRRTTGHDDELTKQQIELAKQYGNTEEVMAEIADEKIERSSTGFLSDENGLYIDTYQLKAMFKQSASMLGIYKKKRGSKQICAEGAEVKGLIKEDRVYLGKSKPDGTDENIVHAMTPKGQISGIKHVDYVTGCTIAFEIWVLRTAAQETRHVSEDDVIHILTFAQENGVGADRARGHGKFNVSKFQRISTAKSITEDDSPKSSKPETAKKKGNSRSRNTEAESPAET